MNNTSKMEFIKLEDTPINRALCAYFKCLSDQDTSHRTMQEAKLKLQKSISKMIEEEKIAKDVAERLSEKGLPFADDSLHELIYRETFEKGSRASVSFSEQNR